MCLALIDSAIPLKGMFCSLSITTLVFGNENVVLVDPDAKELLSTTNNLTTVFTTNNYCIATYGLGPFHGDTLIIGIELAQTYSHSLLESFRNIMETKFNE